MSNRVLSPALRDLMPILGGLSWVDNQGLLEDVLKLALVQGVKIGGTYRHWKGKEYIVESVSKDADDWENYFVTYYEVTDARHKATRRLSWFLGDMNDERYIGPRFRLVG